MRLESFRGGSYIPRCNPDGTFAKKQCNYTSHLIHCWNVDKEGRRTGEPDQLYPLGTTIRPTREPSIKTTATRSVPLTNEAGTTTMRGYTNPYIYGNEVVEGRTTAKTEKPQGMKMYNLMVRVNVCILDSVSLH